MQANKVTWCSAALNPHLVSQSSENLMISSMKCFPAFIEIDANCLKKFATKKGKWKHVSKAI